MATVEQEINFRFRQVMADHIGYGRKFRYKAEFATAIGMLPQELNRIENGSMPQLRHIKALNRKLSVDLNWLIAGVGKQVTSSPSIQIPEPVFQHRTAHRKV